MLYRFGSACRIFAGALIICSLTITLVSRPSAQSRNGAHRPATRTPGGSAHDIHDGEGKKRLTRDQLAKEAWVWHEANLQRLERTDPLGAAAMTSDVTANDVNDISVVEGDNRLISPANLFDLNGRAVQFTPSGSGYTVTSAAATFDTNFGTKLNLTTSPAVNPKAQAELGDDGYLSQDLGFNFSFFGTIYSSLAVTSNGNLTFRPASNPSTFDQDAVSSIATLSEFQSGLPRIAPYWHDLDARASQTSGANGIYLRRDSDRVLVTWNNIRDFPNDPTVDNGLHRFQVTLFNNGRIVFTYDTAQLTSQALAGISPGNTQNVPTLVDFINPPSGVINNPISEFFSISTKVDYLGAIQVFYATHPNRDVYDFVYFMTDFDFDLGGGAFAFFLSIRNEATGIGLNVFDQDPGGSLGGRKIQGILNLSNLNNAYPASPVTRFLGANHALSVFGQEQGHRWMSFIGYPGNDLLLLGRDDAHWSFFLNIESNISSPAAPRSSSMEGNVWRDNGDGTFTSTNLIDGYSLLDQYLMGLRPASDVPDTFVIANPFNTIRTRESSPRPNTIVNGTRQAVTINQIIQANNSRNPTSATSQKNFRAAVILLTRQGTQPSTATLDKITLYRLAWESYFNHSTDLRASLNTGLADQTVSRVVIALSGASFKPTLTPGEIAALFGNALTAGATQAATSQPLPTTLAGTQVRINGVEAPLFYASPTQVNFQVPRNTSATTLNPSVQSSTALIEVISNGQLIRAGAFQIAPAVPAIFTLTQNGTGEAAALDGLTGALGPFNAKQANGQPNVIAVFGSGFGADATDVDGNVSGSFQATIDGNPVTVGYAGRAPGFTGLNQINMTFPANITSGTKTLIISRNGIPSRAVNLTIK